MSRQKRKLSQTGLYHIIFRGISRQNIFEEHFDFEKMKQILIKVKDEMNFEMYAYCFMTNHVHLFIKENNRGDISKIMTKILSHYALWFNKKYDRSGVLFADRYKSEPVEDERYYIGLIRYIHQNPVKARIVDNPEDYLYSSYREYVNGNGGFVDMDFTLNMLGNDRKKAVAEFVRLNSTESDESFEIKNSQRNNLDYIRRIIMSEIDGKRPESIKSMDKSARNYLIQKLVFEKGISKTALERVTGISRGTIIRVCSKM